MDIYIIFKCHLSVLFVANNERNDLRALTKWNEATVKINVFYSPASETTEESPMMVVGHTRMKNIH